MKKVIILLGLIMTIVVTAGIIIYRIFFYNPLLSGEFDLVDKVVIELQENPERYDGNFISKELTIQEDKEQILRLYNEIKKTKIKHYPFDNECPQNDKYFVIKIFYKDHKVDIIEPSETCDLIYKNYSRSNGWSGGVNENVVKIVEEICRKN